MPRRALRKIDPTLDLSRYLKLPAELPRPWDADALFDRSAPLEIEVGSGKGLFMHSAASGKPEHNFLGIEIATKYARFAAARVAGSGLENAVMVHGDDDGMRTPAAAAPRQIVIVPMLRGKPRCGSGTAKG